MNRLKVFRDNGEDISNLIETRNGRSNPFGWSSYELWYKDALGVEEQVGTLYCGEPKPKDGFKMEVVDDTN